MTNIFLSQEIFIDIDGLGLIHIFSCRLGLMQVYSNFSFLRSLSTSIKQLIYIDKKL